jgi:Kef-type K+ transport system membrane component KefB/Trk K+ transport system NAD-binding subunit
MGHDILSFKPLLLVTLLAFVVPFLIYRIRIIRIPVVVGEIICGIVVGKSGFNLIANDQLLDFLSLLGFTYLMFLGGMEINFSEITGAGRKGSSKGKSFLCTPLNLSLVIFIGTMALGWGLSLYFMKTGLIHETTHPLMLTLMICTTSVGVVLPTLKEAGLMKSAYGQTLLTSAIIADFSTIVLATLAMVLLKPGEKGAIEVLGLIGLSVLFYFIFRAGESFTSRPFVKRIYEELSHTSTQLRIRTAFALMLLFTVLSRVVGVEMILGAFVAGTIFNTLFRNESALSEAKFDAIGYGFLIPIFFIMVGVRLDLSALWGTHGILRVLILLIGMAFLVKMLPSLILAPRFGLRNSLAGGFLLNGRMSLIIAFAQVAVAAKLLEPKLQPIAVVIALVTCTVSPVAFMKLWRKDAQAARIGIVILGAGKMGRLLAKRFHERQHIVSLLDNDIQAIEKARDTGLPAHHYKNLDDMALKQAGTEVANYFVAVTNDDKVNLDACLLVRDTFGIYELVARVGNPDNIHLFVENNIRPMNTTLAAAVALENIVYRPSVFSVLSHGETTTEVIEVKVRNAAIAGRRLSDITMPGNALVLLVENNGLAKIPHGGTILELDDTVTIFLNVEAVVDVARFFEPERPDFHAPISTQFTM